MKVFLDASVIKSYSTNFLNNFIRLYLYFLLKVIHVLRVLYNHCMNFVCIYVFDSSYYGVFQLISLLNSSCLLNSVDTHSHLT